jgi:hypothetical protein
MGDSLVQFEFHIETLLKLKDTCVCYFQSIDLFTNDKDVGYLGRLPRG